MPRERKKERESKRDRCSADFNIGIRRPVGGKERRPGLTTTLLLTAQNTLIYKQTHNVIYINYKTKAPPRRLVGQLISTASEPGHFSLSSQD